MKRHSQTRKKSLLLTCLLARGIYPFGLWLSWQERWLIHGSKGLGFNPQPGIYLHATPGYYRMAIMYTWKWNLILLKLLLDLKT